MKHIMPIFVAIISIAIFIATIDFKKTYQEGWKKGYKAGYCYQIVNCIDPIVPVCPIPIINFTTYQDGYDRAFLEGKEDQDEN